MRTVMLRGKARGCGLSRTTVERVSDMLVCGIVVLGATFLSVVGRGRRILVLVGVGLVWCIVWGEFVFGLLLLFGGLGGSPGVSHLEQFEGAFGIVLVVGEDEVVVFLHGARGIGELSSLLDDTRLFGFHLG